MAEYDFQYKIVLIGDPGVGKSNICLRYMKNDFKEESKTTIGVEFQAKKITTDDGKTIKAQIWDTAGEEKYKSVTQAYFRGAVGALLIYDITDEKTFKNAADWLRRLHESAGSDLIVMLVGNKCDLADQRKVST
jgi:Ras-related protein Rab-11A